MAYPQPGRQAAYVPPHHRQPSPQPTSSGMDVDDSGRADGGDPNYVYFERHPERYENARQKATGVRMRLELWYKDGVEGAVKMRER